MFISSKDNPKIKKLSGLISSKKQRNSEGAFVIEGVRSCTDAIIEWQNGRLDIQSVFCTRSAADMIAQRLGARDLEMMLGDRLFEISDQLAAKVSDEGNTQGAFVIAAFLHKSLSGPLQGRRYVVLDNIQDPGNLGTILRTADAVGADGVILTNNCTELYNPKVIRSSMGSISRIEVYIERDLEQVISVLKTSKIKSIAAVVREGRLLSGYSFPDKCAIVIGNEGRGLTDEHISLCDDCVTIDMHGRLDSLNASVAAAVLMWEMSKGG